MLSLCFTIIYMKLGKLLVNLGDVKIWVNVSIYTLFKALALMLLGIGRDN